MICNRCLNGRHARCEDRVGCTCSVCAARPRSIPKKAARPAPSDSKPKLAIVHTSSGPVLATTAPVGGAPVSRRSISERPAQNMKAPKAPAPKKPPAPRKTGPGTECTVDDCTQQIEALGYCQSHYRRLRQYGDPLHVPHVIEPTQPADVELLDLDLIPRLPGCDVCGLRRSHWNGCPKG